MTTLLDIENQRDIKTIKDGMTVEGIYIAEDLLNCYSSNGKPYLKGILKDKTGTIQFKAWEYDAKSGPIENGSFVKIVGTVGRYNEKMQLNVREIKAISADEYDLEKIRKRIVPHAPISVFEYMSYLYEQILSIKDTQLRELLSRIMFDIKELFMTIPAGKSKHHAFVNGLLMHTVDMLKGANAFAEIYKDTVCRDLLIAGCMLHDIGKIEEYIINSATGLVTGYTMKGNGLGHPALGAMMIEKYAGNDVGSEKITMLQHLILSHHGYKEYDGTKEPVSIEAELLHILDMADSRTEVYGERLGDVNNNKSGAYLKSMNKFIYNSLIVCS